MTESRKLLTAIAQAKRAAIVLHEDGDDDLPGAVGSFVLLYPNGCMTVCAEQFMREAVMLFIASQKKAKEPWKRAQISREDIPRADRLLKEMRDALRTRKNETVIIPPPDWKRLCA